MTETLASRPMPQRPATGLLAWQSTIGYICSQYQLIARLTLQAFPGEAADIRWNAEASWGSTSERVTDLPSLAAALRELWSSVDHRHVIFDTREGLLRRPAHYDDDEWLDADTSALLKRLLDSVSRLFGPDWVLVLTYQPVDNPFIRFEGRLQAAQGAISVGGQGPTLRDVCRELFRSAARRYLSQVPTGHQGAAE